MPARRLLSRLPAPRPAADRHPRRLRARRLRRVHGAARRRSRCGPACCSPSTRRRARGHDRRGARHARGHAPGAAGVPRVPRAAVRVLHARASSPRPRPSSRTTRTRREAEAREAISGNLCRCTGYQNIVASVLRAAEITRERRRQRRVTTKLFGEPVQRVEDAKLVTGTRALPRRPRPGRAGGRLRAQPARARPRRRHRRDRAPSTSTVWSPSTPTTTCRRGRGRGQRGAEPLPLLIPHPALHAPRTGYPLARDEVNHVGEAVVMVVAADRYIAEDAAERIVVTYDVPAARRRRRQRPRAPTAPCTTTCPTTSPPTCCRRSATSRRRWPRRRTRSSSSCRHRAQRVDADGGQGRLRALGRRRRARCASTPRPRPRPACGPPSPRSSACR